METAAVNLAALGVDPAVTPVVTRDQVRYAKPDPDLASLAAARAARLGCADRDGGGGGRRHLGHAGGGALPGAGGVAGVTRPTPSGRCVSQLRGDAVASSATRSAAVRRREVGRTASSCVTHGRASVGASAHQVALPAAKSRSASSPSSGRPHVDEHGRCRIAQRVVAWPTVSARPRCRRARRYRAAEDAVVPRRPRTMSLPTKPSIGRREACRQGGEVVGEDEPDDSGSVGAARSDGASCTGRRQRSARVSA